MQGQKIKLLIPHKLPGLLKDKRHLQRITATLLLLKSLFPEGRFQFCDLGAVAELCGFKSRRGFKNHIDELACNGLITFEKNEAHKTNYVNLASWPVIKKFYNYERNYFLSYEVDFCTSNNVLALLIDLAIQSEHKFFHECFRNNLNGNPELKEAIQTVCGDLSQQTIHHYQLKAFTEGVPAGMSDDYYYAAYMLLHATKIPKGAAEDETGNKARRFFIKADTNVSVGYLSRVFGYKYRNGMSYWKGKLQMIGLTVCSRREYKIKNKLRTTTEARMTGIGNTYYDASERCLKLRLTDEWRFISPEVAFSKQASELACKYQKAA